jgi:hypothetical protein
MADIINPVAPQSAQRYEGEGMTEFTMRRIRNEIIVECANAIEKYGLDRVNDAKDYPATIAAACAYHILKLKR